MLTSSVSRASGRRGIVLVLVLAMLGLLALVGVTFATYAGQSRINNRIFMQSLFQPQADELIDFGLAQLITDTNDIRSAIRGHSLARDMYGNDATGNSILSFSPTSGLAFQITAATQSATANQYILTTNIASNDPSFYGYNFQRWIMRVAYTAAPTGGTGVINQTFEILLDDTSNAARQFTVLINTVDAGGQPLPNPINPADPYVPQGMGTALYNPTAGLITQLPGLYISNAAINNTALGANNFTLDGRWMHAFNGPGAGQSLAVTGTPASYYGNYRFTGPYANLGQPGLGVPPPGRVGMDEDYDACDLENWFMAIQSADGQVVIPSFHRPAIIRIDNVVNATDDWLRQNQSNGGSQLWADSAARILRPCKADGHDAATFPDLRPDPVTGEIAYDVDNDGDGKPDSVWVDLGYPARRDASGRLYKPLFAFMVIGLNGRVPLNTAGNLADLTEAAGVFIPTNANTVAPPAPRYYGGPTHASHLGNSMSEVDPTYALQGGFDPNSFDPVAGFAPPGVGYVYPAGGTTYAASNTQVDSAGIDVRLTQLRSLLAGTRPAGTGGINGDTNFVLATGGLGTPPSIAIPNGIADLADAGRVVDATSGFAYVERSTTPVPGRWGEAQSVPGTRYPNPNPAASATPPTAPPFVNVLGGNDTLTAQGLYTNPVRAGYSFNIYDIISGLPPDAGDDNFNTYDPYPPRSATVNATTVNGGEFGDRDFYDPMGALLFPVERMRRWVTPADINGTGSVTTWNQTRRARDLGADQLGRVEFSSYFRPPGSPGAIATGYTANTTSGAVTSLGGATMGAVSFPDQPAFYPDSYNPANIQAPGAGNTVYPYMPDMTSNPLHGLESARFPNQNYAGFTPQASGGSPAGVTIPAPGPIPPGTYSDVDTSNIPTAFPTYDYYINSNFHTDGLNEADEMDLYSPNPLLDSPFGPGDIEWLYRQQDVDGATLSSRLSKLAPVSFTNALDGARRRRLFALDSWDLNNFTWTGDNPVQPTFLTDTLGNITQTLAPVFPNNSRFVAGQSGGFRSAGLPTPGLAHRGKKVNLNYPLPVSNDPDEPIRQKWISDTYQLLRSILPPRATDTPEEKAQLSQYLINVIDFRDTDSTMTHWVNPEVDVMGVLQQSATVPPLATTTVPATAVTLVPRGTAPPIGAVPPITSRPLEQYGMEFNPVALNEVLAFSYIYGATSAAGSGTRANRFFVELVNTQTAPELSTAVFNAPSATPAGSGFTPVVDLGGFVYTMPAMAGGASDPYSGGAWDIIFTADDPYSRPDPYTGQLVPYGNTYAATPLGQYTFNPPAGGVPTTYPNHPDTGTATTTATDGYNVMLQPLDQQGTIPPAIAANTQLTSPSNPNLMGITSPLATDYFYVIGNTGPGAANEIGTPAPGTNLVVDNPPVGTTTGGNGPKPDTYATQIVVDATATPPTFSTTPPASMIQSFKTAMDPVMGPLSTTSPIPIYPGVLPYVQLPTGATGPNPSLTTGLPSNYNAKLPVANLAVATVPPSPQYYWVCLRRPANLFAPVSASNPMIVVDSTRFPFVDGTGLLGTNNGPGGAGPTNVPIVTPATGATTPTGNYFPYSVQRYQPYRGGHAVPIGPPATGPYTNVASPVDPRYGYTEQIVVPGPNSLMTMGTLGTRGIYYQDTSTGTPTNYYATPQIYHTLGWANEYEQGSSNSVAERWDYFPFNDRDFTSVAELLLVPGCSPGLFTKQFVEFAPSYGNVLNIFNAVVPSYFPPTQSNTSTAVPPVTTYGSPNGTIQGQVATVPFSTFTYPTTPPPNVTLPAPPPQLTNVQAYNTASTPFTYATAAGATPEPHTFPYLNDEFFYTGFGGPDTNTYDTINATVGGYAADGWFKMFEFFEVPSQSIGAIGPVALGSNFDWYRQDIKPGQLNLNLIMDEEVFFSLTGDQTIAQSNGQNGDDSDPIVYKNPTDQFAQQLLNFNQIGGLPLGNYALTTSTPAAPNFMLVAPAVGSAAPGGTPGYSPVPLVVTSTLANGTPASAHPITSQGMAAFDPVGNFYFGVNNPGTGALTGPYYPYSNNLKTAWVQFLNLRHGGSGYLFGFGTGAVGQNATVGIVNPTGPMTTVTPPEAIPANLTNSVYGTGIPADRPFRSLSYPDINYTVMRPAALPPSAYTNPVANSAATTYDNTTTPPTPLAYYAGDPGVRNPTLFLGYPTATYPGTPPAGLTGTRPAPWSTGGVPVTYDPVYPPAIATRRLFQVPDAYAGGVDVAYNTMANGPGVTAGATLTFLGTTNGGSNAGAAGDRYLNNQSPVGVSATTNLPYTAPGTLGPAAYAGGLAIANLTGGSVNLYWPGGTAATLYDGISGDAPGIPTGSPPIGLPAGVSNPNLGSGGTTGGDNSQHPYWRSEQIQRIMNLTTPRTHQYAVWITVGFFEVKRQGDLGMYLYDPVLAFDILGPEIGAANGKSTRYRGFFLVDRTRLTGFNPSSPSGFRQAVVFRQRIQ